MTQVHRTILGIVCAARENDLPWLRTTWLEPQEVVQLFKTLEDIGYVQGSMMVFCMAGKVKINAEGVGVIAKWDRKAFVIEEE